MRVIMIDDNGRQHDITAQVKNIVESTEMGQHQQAAPVHQPRPQGRFEGRPAPSPFNRPMAHVPEMHRPYMAPMGAQRTQMPMGGQHITGPTPAPRGGFVRPQGMPMGGQRIPAPMQGRTPMGGHGIPAPQHIPMPQGMPMGGQRIPAPQGGFGRPMGMPMRAPQGMPMGGQEFGDDQIIPVAIDPMTGQPMDFGQQMPEPSASPAGSPYYRPYWQDGYEAPEYENGGQY